MPFIIIAVLFAISTHPALAQKKSGEILQQLEKKKYFLGKRLKHQ